MSEKRLKFSNVKVTKKNFISLKNQLTYCQ